MASLEEIVAQLELWVTATFGSDYRSSNVDSLGGHSGVTVGFDVTSKQVTVERLVLKIPPPGVVRKNNFDVLRQVPVLKSLEKKGIPAPRARFWSDDESFFQAPYLIMSRLAGHSPPDLFRETQPDQAEKQHLCDSFDQAIKVLADIHSLDTRLLLQEWDGHRDVDREIEHWGRIFKKTKNSEWLGSGQELEKRLIEKKPTIIPEGLTHGDYYSNNWVFNRGKLSGVVDWEGASIGPSLLDVGWLYMIYDRSSWGPTRRKTMSWQPSPEDLVDQYSRAASLQLRNNLDQLKWYRALAAFRITSITAYYYEEHRSGRRVNDAWEVFGEAFPYLIARARELLIEN